MKYAMLFYLTGKAAGLEVRYSEGIAPNSDLHAWDLVRIDGEWLTVDPTWSETETVDRWFLVRPENYLGKPLEGQYREKLYKGEKSLRKGEYICIAADIVMLCSEIAILSE